MKFLMIGLGSIGQRHLRNIRRVYGDDAEIIAYRVRGLKRTFSDTMQIREGVSLEEEFGITSYADLDEALSTKPDVAFIANPTNMHIPCAIKCARAGCHLFLEKPISNDLTGIEELKQVAQDNHVQIFVGYQNRLHPGIQALKQTLDAGELGEILSVRVVVGERLTTMHTYEDYKETYMARKDMGGGVVTNQLVHELDYLCYLFGAPTSVFAQGGTLGNLGIDVEDMCDAILTIPGKGRDIAVSCHADFYQSPPERGITVIGSKGKMQVDIIKNKSLKAIGDEVTEVLYDDFQRNDMFIWELQMFIDGINHHTEPEIGLNDGIVSLKLALAIKESMEKGGQKLAFDI